MDDMIEHQIQFEESTETQIDTLKTLLASFSRAMWLEKEGKLRTKSKSPEVLQKKFKFSKVNWSIGRVKTNRKAFMNN